MRDDTLVPKFLTALEETDQPNVVRLLKNGLHTFVVLFVLHVW